MNFARLHRFTEPWEAAASLQLRAGNPRALDAYQAHDRVVAGPFLEHLDAIATDWIGHTLAGHAVAITAATNEHVDALNGAIQRMRLTIGDLRPNNAVWIEGNEVAHSGDIVATRRNERELRTSTGEPVRNRDLWDIASTHPDRSLAVSHRAGHGVVTLPMLLCLVKGRVRRRASARQDRDQPLGEGKLLLGRRVLAADAGWLAADRPADRSQDSPLGRQPIIGPGRRR